MSKKKIIDWEAVEKDYKVGKYGSVRALASYYDISEAAIRKKAKGDPKKGLTAWKKDLVEDYQKGVEEELVRSGTRLSTQNGAHCAPKSDQEIQQDKQIVDEAVKIGVEVVRNHRKKIGDLHEISGSLTYKLKEALLNDNAESLEKWSRFTESPTDMTLKLSKITSELVKLERQAYNLDKKEESDKKKEQDVEDIIRKRMEEKGFTA
jgi:hypothetical protein